MSGHLVDRDTLERYRVALDSEMTHGPWTRATCAAVLRTLDAANERADALEREFALKDRALTDYFADASKRADAAEAERDQLRDALRYILGYDVAGYDAHMRPEEVARQVLGESAA